jgi:hypothetical protein
VLLRDSCCYDLQKKKHRQCHQVWFCCLSALLFSVRLNWCHKLFFFNFWKMELEYTLHKLMVICLFLHMGLNDIDVCVWQCCSVFRVICSHTCQLQHSVCNLTSFITEVCSRHAFVNMGWKDVAGKAKNTHAICSAFKFLTMLGHFIEGIGLLIWSGCGILYTDLCHRFQEMTLYSYVPTCHHGFSPHSCFVLVMT